jgi:hypothetical protein
MYLNQVDHAMWNDEDFQSAIDCVTVAIYKEEIEALKGLLGQICTGKNKAKLWAMLTDMQKEILKHPEFLPSMYEVEYGAAA